MASEVTPIAESNIMDEWLKKEMKNWAIGYRYELGGEIETSGKANKSIFDKLGITVLIILLLLVWQFDSIRKPVIIAATIAGLMPLWLFGGPMWEPMAIAIIFGLAFCTLLTLRVVPMLYSIFFRVKY